MLVIPAVFVAVGCTGGGGQVASVRHHATRPVRTVASPWKVVSYHGVHVRVPTSWPVIDAMHAPWCGGPFTATPTVYIGSHGDLAPSCPAVLPRGPGDDGAWLQAGSPPPDAHRVVLAGGTVVAEERGQAGAWAGRIVQLWYHRVSVEIGIGRHRNVANEILRSLGYTRGKPESKVADVCPRRKGPARMPAPRRLARRLVVELGNITMTPPLRSDQPVMRAAQAWRESGTKSVFERYRLLLVRYSSKYPAAPNAQGLLVPENHDVLAWVVYAFPFSTAVAGCGGWSVYGFNALTGTAMADDGWSPGP